MEQINITEYKKKHAIKKHPSIKGLQIIEGKNNFPISWIDQQDYCEYQIYLEYIKGIKTQPAIHETHKSQIQKELEDIFRQDAEPAEFWDAVEASKTRDLMSREVIIISPDYGIRGTIDEIWMKNDEIVIINERQGRTPYDSAMNQTRACSLAFKDITGDKRTIKSALRERGTDNLFWIEVFTPEVEKKIISKVNRIHGLIEGSESFTSSESARICRSCRFKDICEYAK